MPKPSPKAVTKQPAWVVTLDSKEYVNSTAISGNGALVVAGTFFHSYKKTGAMSDSPPQETTLGNFGTYCFDRKGKQLWADKFTGYEGVYGVAISDDGSTAASGGWYSNQPYQGFVRAYSTTNGTQLLNYLVPNFRVGALAFSADGSTLVAGGDQLYLFQRSGGVFPKTPSAMKLSGTRNSVQALSVSTDGSAIVMGDANGNVYLIQNNNGQIGQVYKWNSAALKVVHAVPLAAKGGWFAVVGFSQYVYLFTIDTIKQGKYFAAYDLGKERRCGWASISADGKFISAICNNDKAGLLYGLQNKNQELSLLWSAPQPTAANPNSTSVDAKSKYVTVADGYPDGTPGDYYLFDAATGNQLWQYTTKNMNWPMFISSDGSGIVAGSDLGTVYYFTPV